MSKIIQSAKPEPFNWATYQRTGNNAIDLVAQAVGYHRQIKKPLKAIILKPMSYELFKRGTEVLAKQRIEDPATEMLFDGVTIKCGNPKQFDTMIFEYWPVPKKQMN